jgi:hypothetical protein
MADDLAAWAEGVTGDSEVAYEVTDDASLHELFVAAFKEAAGRPLAMTPIIEIGPGRVRVSLGVYSTSATWDGGEVDLKENVTTAAWAFGENV